MKIGDVVYPAGCSRDIQLKNPILINHIEMRIIPAIIDGEVGEFLSASENGYIWYPLSSLTMEVEVESG